MQSKIENKDAKETNSTLLSDFSGRFDDLGEDLIKLSSPEHICTIYRSNNDMIASIMEFLKTGIVKNERCVIIVDKYSKENIQNKMKSMGDIKNLLNTSAIVLVDSEDIYGNRFDFNIARAIESIKSYFEAPREDNFNGLRIILDILPVRNKNTTMNLSLEFHSSIDKLISNRNINLFCLYNEYKFESKTLLDVIILHSKIIFNGFLCENYFSMNPHEPQMAQESRLEDALYKKTVYDIVQREVTKQKRVKKDSYIQEETLKSINDSVFILDFEGNILEVNEAAYKTRGYTEEEILSLNIIDIISLENKYLFNSRIEELKKKGEITFESIHYCKNGTLLDVEFKTKIITYDDQQYILSIGRDITERKRIEKEAKASEEKYRSIFNNANETIFLLKESEDGRFNKIVGANRQAVKMYGYSIEELLKMSPNDFNATGYYVETDETLTEFLKERRIRFERTHKTKKGKIIEVEISSQLFELDGETVSHAMIQDITDRKKAQKELKKNKLDLRERVKELTTIHNISKYLVETDKTIEEVLYKIIEFIPAGWQYPDCTAARILLEEQQFVSGNFIESQWNQTAKISLEDEIIGEIEVCYTESKPDLDEGPFLQEERNLIEEIARQISVFITRTNVFNELKKSENEHRLLFSEMNEGFVYNKIICDAGGKPINFEFVKVNKKFEELTGFSAESVIGKRVTEVLPGIENDPADWIGKFGKVAIEGTLLKFEQFSEPLQRWISVSAYSPVKDYFVIIFDDTTEKRKLEKERETVEKQLQLLKYSLDSSLSGTAISDLNDKIIYVNDAFLQLWGYETSEELLGKGVELILQHTLTDIKITNKVKSEFLNLGSWIGDVRSKKLDGSPIWVKMNWNIVLDSNDEPIAKMVSFLDISNEKQIAQTLINSEEKFRMIFNNVNDAVYLFCIDDEKIPSNFIEINDVACKMLGYTEDEFRKMSPSDLTSKSVTKKIPEIMNKLTNLKNLTFESIHFTKEEEGIPVEISSHTFLHNNKQMVLSIVRDISERKKTEEKIKENEKKFRTLYDEMKQAYALYEVIYDNIGNPQDGKIVELNPEYEKLTNRKREDSIGKKISEAYPQGQHQVANTIKVLSKTIITGETMTLEYYSEDISKWIFAKSFSPMKDHVAVLFEDITERKKAEDKLKRLNEELEEKVIQRTYQMETLYNIIKEISETFDLNEAMRIITKYISKLVDYDIIVQLITQEKLNHIRLEAPKGDKGVIDDFIKNVKEEFLELNPDALNNRDATTVIASNKKPIKNISSHISIPLIAEDKVVGFIVIGSEQEDAYIEEEIWFLYKIADNISYTLQRLKVVLTAKDELETVLDHTSDGVILINSNDSVVMSNKAGSRFLESINYSKTDGINNEILNLEELKGIDKKELFLHGKVYYVSMNPIKTDFVYGWLLTIHDITEERDMQKKILHQERLATLGKITGGIAHDFNNILASIIGAADFSLMSVDNIESKEFLNLIIRQSEKGASLIRQMLDFTRQAVIRPKPISLLDFISEFSRFIRSSLPENISLLVNSKELAVFMDQVQLQQLFLNLIFNSRDALIEGGKITITIEEIENSKIIDIEEIEIDKNQDYIHFVVEDNGEGMNEQTKKMIFEPFFTTKDPGKGSGLGLAQVYGIVRQSNGYIYVESEMKLGTKIHFYIPKYEGLVEEEIEETTRLGEGRILLVEDDEDVREITKIMLENYGYVVVTAENGKIALDLYNNSFDLVLTDIIMPVMGGEKLIEKLLEINPQIKCLAMTGYSDANVPEGVRVLNKPITSSKLVNYIQNEIEQENCREKKTLNKKRGDGG